MPLASSARRGCKPSRSRFPKRSNGSHILRSSVSRTRASTISARPASLCCGPGAWRSRPEIDEEKVGSIPGFGRSLTERLVNWREGLEQRFHFEPAAITDPRDVQRIDRELAARRTRYVKELRRAIFALETRINDIGDERRDLWQRVEAAFHEHMLARHSAEVAGCP
jgi:DNA-binding helix-hairpin-helix protein with protein kinase domain